MNTEFGSNTFFVSVVIVTWYYGPNVALQISHVDALSSIWQCGDGML